jgi:Zn-dependent peptidase ImmA (M78 family)
MTTIEKQAEELLEVYGLLGGKTNLKELCRKLDLEVHAHPFQGCEGVLLVTECEQRILINSSKAPTRNRYTIAHEIGHYSMHIPVEGNRVFNCSKDQVGSDRQVSEKEENEANSFASALLMPSEIFKKNKNFSIPSWNSLNELAGAHEVSLIAAATRYIDLTTESMWLIVVASGKIKRFVKPSFVESVPTVGHQFTTKKITEWIEIIADNIFYDNRWTRNKTVFISSIGENDYGENLVLVWDKKHSLMSLGDEYNISDYDSDEYYERSTRSNRRWGDS